MTDSPWLGDACSLVDAFRSGERSPQEEMEAVLAAIDGSELNAFCFTDPDGARAAAAEADVGLPFGGIPLGVKELDSVEGWPATGASLVFAGEIAEHTGTMVRRLEGAGVAKVGLTTASEFGGLNVGITKAHGTTHNPWRIGQTTGGSSAGSAAAVAGGLVAIATGGDGGGSIRIPAASCGLVGVKPSRARVPSGSGLDRLAGLGVVGPIARTVADAALLLDGMIAPRGYPASHPFAVRAPGEDGPYLGAAIRGEGRYQVGVLRDSPWDDFTDIRLDPPAGDALETAIRLLDRLGHGVEELTPSPEPDYAAAFRTVWQSGAATIDVPEERHHLLEPLTRWLMGRGRALGAAELAGALSWLAGFERRTIARFAPYDAVLTPALALTPRPVGWYDAEDGEENFAQQVRFTPYTSFVNVAGLPALVLPVQDTAEGLPMGVQLIGRPGGESTLFALAAQLERVARRGRRRPPVW
jgi:amidase